jgi:hypothetical protein
MKKLTQFLAICVFTLMAFGARAQQALDHNSLDATGAVVSRKKSHTFVKNGHDQTLAQGAAVCYSVTADDGITVAKCPADGAWGACMIDESCATGAMCKCLVEGYTAAMLYNGAEDDATAGKLVYVGSEGTFEAELTPSTQNPQKPVGYFLDSTGTSGAVKAYLKF